MGATVLVGLSSEQEDRLACVFADLANEQEGAAIIAQVYPDGMRVKAISKEQTAEIARILGVNGELSCSAAEAHLKALARKAKES